MIRYYAYYNHGGYKDFYVGNTKEIVTSKYFLPLLAVHEQSLEENPNDEALKEQIEHQRQLPKLVALSDATPDYNYPKEARVLMSHGGYKILYKRLDYKNYALAIRDIPGPKDVYGRQSPFNMMFIGDEDDLVGLDKLAEHIRNNYCQFLEFLGTLFVNDLNENGLRCDNDRLTSLLHSIIECNEAVSPCVSYPLHVRMLVVGSPCDLKTTFKEQNISKREVNVCFDETGNLLFKAIEEQPNARTNASSINVEQEKPHTRQDAADRKNILSLHAMTNTPKIEDIEKIWDYIRGMEKRTVQMSKHIEELEKRITELENRQNYE